MRTNLQWLLGVLEVIAKLRLGGKFDDPAYLINETLH